MSTSTGSSIFASWSTKMPITAREGSWGSATVLTVTSLTSSPRRTVRRDVVARLDTADLSPELSGRYDGHSVHADDHVVRLEHPGGRHVRIDARDEHAAGRRGHLVAERAECDDRRDLLGALHVLGVLPVTLCVGRPVGGQCLRRDERRAVGSGEREELLELADAPHEDVRVVDVALGVRPAALDLDLAGERLGAVGHEEVVVGGEPPEQERGGREPDQTEHDRGAGEPLQVATRARG